jgi:hypothetical protein
MRKTLSNCLKESEVFFVSLSILRWTHAMVCPDRLVKLKLDVGLTVRPDGLDVNERRSYYFREER